MAEQYPVHSVDDAYNACYPDEPLGPDDPRYVDLTPVRGGKSLAVIIGRRIRRTRPPHYHQQLISGHRGSGKSTELRRLQQELRNEKLFAVYLDIEDLLDLGEVHYQDVLVAIAQTVERDLRTAGIAISAELLEELKTWFHERILTSEQKRDIEYSLKAEAGIEGKVPFLARALASITSQIKSGSSQKQEIRHKLEQELSGFIERLNTLLSTARRNLAQKGFVDLVVLVDGLEKMQYHLLSDGESTHSALFIHHAAQLRAPQCHLVYTVPISLVFRASLGNSFSDSPFLLPMVDYTSDEGKRCLRQVVAQRLDIAQVFDAEATVDRLIEMSGGAVRDLLRLIRMACDDALDRISARDGEAAVLSLTGEFDRFLKDEEIAPLLAVARTRTVSYDDTAARLLELRMIHEYQNLLAERWADLHPALRRVKRLQTALSGGMP